mmetsp:Transcript_17909/g.42544  ORF Transcript_17909/g.42544 Transcript_17909/m.42544 type:complete len:218 (+) Transcript_17909:691-1344(+)
MAVHITVLHVVRGVVIAAVKPREAPAGRCHLPGHTASLPLPHSVALIPSIVELLGDCALVCLGECTRSGPQLSVVAAAGGGPSLGRACGGYVRRDAGRVRGVEMVLPSPCQERGTGRCARDFGIGAVDLDGLRQERLDKWPRDIQVAGVHEVVETHAIHQQHDNVRPVLLAVAGTLSSPLPLRGVTEASRDLWAVLLASRVEDRDLWRCCRCAWRYG